MKNVNHYSLEELLDEDLFDELFNEDELDEDWWSVQERSSLHRTKPKVDDWK